MHILFRAILLLIAIPGVIHAQEKPSVMAHAQGTDTLDRNCGVGPDRYAIIDCTEQRAWCPLTGLVCPISFHEVERAECVFDAFLQERLQRGRAFRDSIFVSSEYRIRPERFVRPLSSYYRQYAGECNAHGDTLVHVNALCEVTSEAELAAMEALMGQHKDIPSTGRGRGWRYGWVLTNDGGDCYFQVTVNLAQGRVEGFSVNGPYTPSLWDY